MNATPEQIEAHYQKQLKQFNEAIQTQLQGKQDEIDRLMNIIERYMRALEMIQIEDGPGLDLSPSGKCYEIATKALKQ